MENKRLASENNSELKMDIVSFQNKKFRDIDKIFESEEFEELYQKVSQNENLKSCFGIEHRTMLQKLEFRKKFFGFFTGKDSHIPCTSCNNFLNEKFIPAFTEEMKNYKECYTIFMGTMNFLAQLETKNFQNIYIFRLEEKNIVIPIFSDSETNKSFINYKSFFETFFSNQEDDVLNYSNKLLKYYQGNKQLRQELDLEFIQKIYSQIDKKVKIDNVYKEIKEVFVETVFLTWIFSFFDMLDVENIYERDILIHISFGFTAGFLLIHFVILILIIFNESFSGFYSWFLNKFHYFPFLFLGFCSFFMLSIILNRIDFQISKTKEINDMEWIPEIIGYFFCIWYSISSHSKLKNLEEKIEESKNAKHEYEFCAIRV